MTNCVKQWKIYFFSILKKNFLETFYVINVTLNLDRVFSAFKGQADLNFFDRASKTFRRSDITETPLKWIH